MKLFAKGVQQDALDSLIKGADQMLTPVGFQSSAPGEWTRKASWKREEVDLRLQGISSLGLQPAFRVALPRTSTSPVGARVV